MRWQHSPMLHRVDKHSEGDQGQQERGRLAGQVSTMCKQYIYTEQLKDTPYACTVRLHAFLLLFMWAIL